MMAPGWESTAMRRMSPVPFFLLLLPSLLAAHERFRVETITPQQGLSSGLVTGILQDRRGFLWFGTMDGLNRFDGNRFTVFKPVPGDTNSLSAHYINVLSEDSFGDLWINAIGGLHQLDVKTGRISRVLSGMWHTAVCEDTSAGRDRAAMWFGTLGHGLHRWDRTTRMFTHFAAGSGGERALVSDSVLSLAVDGAGNLWIGTIRGLDSFDPRRSRITHYPGGPQGRVQALLPNGSAGVGGVWIGTDQGLYRYDARTGAFRRHRNLTARPGRVEDNDARTLFADSRGVLWVGMIGGIARFDSASASIGHYQHDVGSSSWAYLKKAWLFQEDANGTLWSLAHGSPDPNPLRRFDTATQRWVGVSGDPATRMEGHSFLIDRSGITWLGTVDRGVLKVERIGGTFATYLAGEDPAVVIGGIAEDPSGIVWLGSTKGLLRFDPLGDSLRRYTHDPRNPRSLSSDDVGPVLADRGGDIWVGAGGGGVDVLDPVSGSIRHLPSDPSDSGALSSPFVGALAESGEGNIWVGTHEGGLNEWVAARNRFRRHTPEDRRFAFASVVDGIVIDGEGVLWYIMRGAGLVSYNSLTGVTVPHTGAPPPYAPPITLGTIGLTALAIDRGGTIWVGSNAGLIRFDRRTGASRAVTEQDGLASNLITGIEEDGRGFLWLSTTKGITRYDPRGGSIRNFDAADGVGFGASIRPTGCTTRAGEMYFGGNRGFVRFHPDSIRNNSFVPPVVLTGFKKFGRDVPLDTVIAERQSLLLSHDDNVVTFEFAALNYRSVEKNQYAFKLEGFDREWIHIGTQRSATYTNLPGGEYEFRVRASNNDGVWNDEGASIRVIVAPPFWETWWFRSLVVLALLVTVGGTIRRIEMRKLQRRIAQLEQERVLERERARISRDMHDEVGSSLSEIAILSELAKKDGVGSLRGARHIDQISERAAEVIDSLGQIIWAMNPRNDPLENLVGHLRHYAREYLTGAGVGCRFDVPETLPAYRLPPEARRNVFLVVKEALHNVAKHAGAATVTLGVALRGKDLEISVADDGRGFTPGTTRQEGNGLLNMQKRAGEVGGRLDVASAPGVGTRVVLIVSVDTSPEPPNT